jgi:hypothetical protein
MSFSRRHFMALALLASGGARAQTLDEARVKARLAITLARYTQWPAAAFTSPTDPLLFCVVHRNEMLIAAFVELGDQAVAGHPIKVVTSLPPAGTCHALFVHESAERRGAAALGAVAAQPVLTIGDGDGFAARGGMVELVNFNDATRLDVNLKVIRAARLDLSSQVLKLARQVRE